MKENKSYLKIVITWKKGKIIKLFVKANIESMKNATRESDFFPKICLLMAIDN